MTKIELPWPPSSLKPNNGHGHWKSKWSAGKKYKADCLILAKQYKPLKKFKITFHPPDRKKRDRDNMIAAFKYGQDALAEAWGIDDSEFEIIYSPVGQPVKHGSVIVTDHGEE